MADDPKYNGQPDFSKLFRPISADERLREPVRKPANHTGFTPPMHAGQLYGTEYASPSSLAPPPPLRPAREPYEGAMPPSPMTPAFYGAAYDPPAQPLQPSGFLVPVSSFAPVTPLYGFSTENEKTAATPPIASAPPEPPHSAPALPPYLSKRPVLAPLNAKQREQAPEEPASHRITSTIHPAEQVGSAAAAQPIGQPVWFHEPAPEPEREPMRFCEPEPAPEPTRFREQFITSEPVQPHEPVIAPEPARFMEPVAEPEPTKPILAAEAPSRAGRRRRAQAHAAEDVQLPLEPPAIPDECRYPPPGQRRAGEEAASKLDATSDSDAETEAVAASLEPAASDVAASAADEGSFLESEPEAAASREPAEPIQAEAVPTRAEAEPYQTENEPEEAVPQEPLEALAAEAEPEQALYSAAPRRAYPSGNVPVPEFHEKLRPDFTEAPYTGVNPYSFSELPAHGTGFEPSIPAYEPQLPPMPAMPTYQHFLPVRDEIEAFFSENPQEPTYADAPPQASFAVPAYEFDPSPYETDSLPPSAEPDAQGELSYAHGLDNPAFETESMPQSAELPEEYQPYESIAPAEPVQWQGISGMPVPEQAAPAEAPPATDAWQSAQDYTQSDAQPAPVYVPSGAAIDPKPSKQQKAPKQKQPAGKPSKAKQEKAAPAKDAAPPRERKPIRWQRVLALAATVGMIAFIGIVGGQIVYRLATNEREMKETLENYRQQQGVDLRQSAVRVELPPPDVTFEPPPVTATPAPVDTPQPSLDPVAAVLSKRGIGEQDAGAETEAPSPTPLARTRLTRYPNNTLRNVLESMSALSAEYSDVVGRLTISGVLDEIVVQRNNTHYLTRNFRGSLAEGGAVFVDESCSIDIPPENLLLRAQGSVPGKTFSPLWQYQTGGEAFVKTATTATLTTLYEEANYVLLAVIVAASDPSSPDYFNYASHPTFSTDEQMLGYVQDAMNHSLYRFSTSIQPNDRLLTLATVSSGSDSRCMVLLFRMLRNGEALR